MCKSASIDCSIDVSKIHFTYTMSRAREGFPNCRTSEDSSDTEKAGISSGSIHRFCRFFAKSGASPVVAVYQPPQEFACVRHVRHVTHVILDRLLLRTVELFLVQHHVHAVQRALSLFFSSRHVLFLPLMVCGFTALPARRWWWLLDAVRILFAKFAVVSDLESVFVAVRKNNLASFWSYVDIISGVDVVAHHVDFILQGINVAKSFFLAFGAESSLFAIPCVAECVCHRFILFCVGFKVYAGFSVARARFRPYAASTERT